MTKNEKTNTKSSDIKSEDLNQINRNVAGIDIGSRENWVSVSPDICENNIRTFGEYTEDLKQIADWLIECKVESVVMESTGIYWVPLYEILEANNIKVNLCNANYAKNLPGRKKTDKHDCDWLRKLHSYGMLNPSFIPDKAIREIKAITRYRSKLSYESKMHVLRIQKSLTLMNFHLHHVVSDITGKTGMNIINAILRGESDPKKLVLYRDIRIKKSKEEMIKALEGNIQFEHIFIMRTSLDSYNFICNKIEECDATISDLYSQLDIEHVSDSDQIKKILKSKEKYELFKNIIKVNLIEIPGIDILSLENLIAETGIDMDKWKDSKHFASWVGLAPNNQITGGKTFSNSTKKINSRIKQILRNCAGSLRNSKSFLGDFFRRNIAKIGYKQAITATARKLAVIYYTMIKDKTEFKDLGENYFSEMNKEKVVNKLKKRAEKLGYQIVPAN